MGEKLILLHLSDIHFRTQKVFDPDLDIRNQLEIDVKRLVDDIGSPEGILISGDIAFSGKAQEYQIAIQWLNTICNLIGCPTENVWCVPGNHDVDRDAINESKLIRSMHEDLRNVDVEKIDVVLEEYLDDGQGKILLYSPIQTYVNEFASKFKCEIDADKPYWKGGQFHLNDGSILRIRGVNSALISDNNDDDGDNRLIIGRYQSSISVEDGVEYIVLCHHPYQWLRSQDKWRRHWLNRAKIHLFGHKHYQRIEEVNGCLVMTSGAMHPDQREPYWIPRYNVLAIEVVRHNSNRHLKVVVFPRKWHHDDEEFQPDFDSNGIDNREYLLPIEEWHGAPELKKTTSTSDEGKNESAEENAQPSEKREKTMNHARRLTYRFLTLPFHTRIQIGTTLALVTDNDKGLQDAELFKNFFMKAKEDDKLADLWEEVEKAHGGDTKQANPYQD